jgi:hypothetical protein
MVPAMVVDGRWCRRRCGHGTVTGTRVVVVAGDVTID